MVAGVVGFIISFLSLKKSGRKKIEELRDHLDTIGVKAWADDLVYGSGLGSEKRTRGLKYLGTIVLGGKEIDSILITGQASQYGINYYLDFMVPSPSQSGRKDKVKMARKRIKEQYSGKKIQDIVWKGDRVLAQKLNTDARLKERLLRADLKPVKNTIEIVAEQESDHNRIRTAYFLPSTEILEILNIIAKHMKAW